MTRLLDRILNRRRNYRLLFLDGDNKPNRAARRDTRLRRTAAHRYMAAVSKAKSVAAEKSLAKIIRAV